MTEKPTYSDSSPVVEILRAPKPRSLAYRMFMLKLRQTVCWHSWKETVFRVAKSDAKQNEITSMESCRRCAKFRIKSRPDTAPEIVVGHRQMQ